MKLRERMLAPAEAPGFSRPRGIVMGAGGHRLLANAYVALKQIRRLSSLPVELCYAGKSELPKHFPARLQEEIPDLTFRDVGAENRGFQLKPLAVLHSEFKELIWLDADNLPLEPLDALFDLPDYTRTGALFWPDLPSARWTQDALFEDLGLDPRRNREQPELESGQMVLDRSRCWRSLQATARLEPEARTRAYGDKDLFRLAFHVTGEDSTLVPHEPVPFGGKFFIWRVPGTSQILKLDHPCGSFYATGILQHHPDGRRLFAHKTVMEWKPHLDFVGMTHVQGAPDPALANLEEWGYQQLRHFRKSYGRLFPPDRGEQLLAVLRSNSLRWGKYCCKKLRRSRP